MTAKGNVGKFNKVIVPATVITASGAANALTLPLYNDNHVGKTPDYPLVELTTNASKLQGNPHKFHNVQVTPLLNSQGRAEFTSVSDDVDLDLSRIGASGKLLAAVEITQSANANTNGIKGNLSKLTKLELTGTAHLQLQKTITLGSGTFEQIRTNLAQY